MRDKKQTSKYTWQDNGILAFGVSGDGLDYLDAYKQTLKEIIDGNKMKGKKSKNQVRSKRERMNVSLREPTEAGKKYYR